MMGDRTVVVQSRRELEGSGGGAADAALSGAVFMVATGEQLESAKAVARHLPFASYAFNPYTDLTAPLADVDAIERTVGFVVTPRAIAAPEIAPAKWPSSPAETRGSYTTGIACDFILRGLSFATVRSPARRPTVSAASRFEA